MRTAGKNETPSPSPLAILEILAILAAFWDPLQG